MKDWLCEIRDAMKAFVRTVGELTLFFINIVMYTPRTLVRRPGLVVKQVFNSGTMSMTIILTCGLFVGMVLGLQGFDTLQRFGADINAHNDEGHALLHIIMDPALIPVAVAAGADAFITGEISEPQAHLARETGVHYFACGHHASERYGVQALATVLADKFDLAHQFIDIDNPV